MEPQVQVYFDHLFKVYGIRYSLTKENDQFVLKQRMPDDSQEIILQSPRMEIVKEYLKGTIKYTHKEMTRLNMDLPSHLHTAFKQMCTEQNKTITEVVTDWIFTQVYHI